MLSAPGSRRTGSPRSTSLSHPRPARCSGLCSSPCCCQGVSKPMLGKIRLRAQRLAETHQADNSVTVDESFQALASTLLDNNMDWNKARSNGLVADASDSYSWENLFYDFLELKASMDALEKRADKIHDGMVGLREESSKQRAELLNLIAAIASVVLLPFTVV